MKTIGLIGGMSWESTQEYYRIINQETNRRRGGLHSAKIMMSSVDFEEIKQLQMAGEWGALTERMIDACKKVQDGGADLVLICTNTMHKMADEVQAQLKIPLLHLVDAVAEEVKKDGNSLVGLLGTKYTMESGFYHNRLRCNGIQTIVPESINRRIVHDVIYQELCLGQIDPESKRAYLAIITTLAERGAQGVILGCTEIPLLVKQEDSSVKLYDSTQIHALAAVDYALK